MKTNVVNNELKTVDTISYNSLQEIMKNSKVWLPTSNKSVCVVKNAISGCSIELHNARTHVHTMGTIWNVLKRHKVSLSPSGTLVHPIATHSCRRLYKTYSALTPNTILAMIATENSLSDNIIAPGSLSAAAIYT